MNIKVDFDNIVVREDRNDTIVKVLMLKGEKGDQGDGEPNVIEKVQVNGTDLTVTNKTVNVPVPTIDSAISSSSTNPVQNNTIYNALSNKVDNSALDNYYEISEVDALLGEKDILLDKKPYYFDNVASMKAYDLQEGDYAITKGYYSVNDGGGGEYEIVNDTLVDDGGSVHSLANGLYAKLIVKENVNVKNFGAYGDGTHNDFIAINKALTYCKNNNKTLISSSGYIYLINEPLVVNTINLDFNYSTLKTNDAIDIIQINSSNYYGSIKNLIIDCNGVALNGIHIINGVKKLIENVNILNVIYNGVKYDAGYEMVINKLNIIGTTTSLESIGLNMLSGDSTITDVITIDCYTAIVNKGKNFYNNIHGWIKTRELAVGSKFIDVTNGNFIGNNIYSDTFHYSFYSNENYSPYIEVTNSLFYWNKEHVMTDAVMGNNVLYIWYNGDENPNGSHSAHILFTNVEINGQIYNSTKVQLTNEQKFYGVLTNSIIYNVDLANNIVLTNNDANLNITTNNCYRLTNEMNEINFLASFDTSVLSGSRTITLGKIPYNMNPFKAINTFCAYGTSEWNHSGFLYCYVGADGTITTSIPSSITGIIYIKLHLVYGSNKL